MKAASRHHAGVPGGPLEHAAGPVIV